MEGDKQRFLKGFFVFSIIALVSYFSGYIQGKKSAKEYYSKYVFSKGETVEIRLSYGAKEKINVETKVNGSNIVERQNLIEVD